MIILRAPVGVAHGSCPRGLLIMRIHVTLHKSASVLRTPFLLLLVLMSLLVGAIWAQDPGWPRQITKPRGKVIFYSAEGARLDQLPKGHRGKGFSPDPTRRKGPRRGGD